MDCNFNIKIEDYTFYGNGYSVIYDDESQVKEILFENLNLDQVKEKLHQIADICFNHFSKK